MPEPTCPLCQRPIPQGARASRHHLVPKLKGGAKGATVLLHQICHSAIHARFSESDLARKLDTVESLRDAPELADFLRWISTKPPDFHAPTASTGEARRRRDARRRGH
jgi:5-methylcytosine-specific restriction enzyme A